MSGLWICAHYRACAKLEVIMNIWFIIAGLFTVFSCALHIFVGGKIAARPLLDARDMSRTAKYTNYYCWHMVTIVLAAMGLMFLWAARHESGIELAVVATVFAVIFMFWSFGVVALSKGKLFQFPQWALFAPIAALGIAGLVLG